MKKKIDTENASQEFALHRACQSDTITGIEELVLKGARIDELDKSGNSAIHYAAANTNPEVVCTLLAAVKKKADQEKNQLKIEAVAAAGSSIASASLPAHPSPINQVELNFPAVWYQNNVITTMARKFFGPFFLSFNF